MISEFSIIKQRKELADSLKEIVEILKQGGTQITQEEATQMECTLATIRTLDWVLNDKEIDMETFFNNTNEKIANEIGWR